MNYNDRRIGGWGLEAVKDERLLAAVRERIGNPEPPFTPEFSIPDKKLDLSDSSMKYSQGDAQRLFHSLGQSGFDYACLKGGKIDALVEGVLYPANTKEAYEAFSYARKKGARLMPFGGGTNVCGAFLDALASGPVIALSTECLNSVAALDLSNMNVTVGAGIRGIQLEKFLEEYTFTTNLCPQSMEFSTVGGWIATNATGIFSTRYGRASDIAVSMDIVNETGEYRVENLPGEHPENVLFHAAVGSMGKCGVITEATLKIFRRPKRQGFVCFFRNFADGVRTLYDIALRGMNPTIVRLCDETETDLLRSQGIIPWTVNLAGFGKKKRSIMLLGFDNATHGALKAAERLLSHRCTFVVRSDSAVQKYVGVYFKAPYMRDLLEETNYFTETLETSAPFTCVTRVREEVLKSVAALDERFKSSTLVLCRVSQMYHTEMCLYFSFIANVRNPARIEYWKELVEAATDCFVQSGARLTHHHGIGHFLKGKRSPEVSRKTALLETIIDKKKH